MKVYANDVRPFNLADYIRTPSDSNSNSNSSSNRSLNLEDYLKLHYSNKNNNQNLNQNQVIKVPMRACIFNNDGTMKVVPLKEGGECNKEKGKGIRFTLADLVNSLERNRRPF